jgi:protein arginine N-methyltransferase 5
MLGWSTKSTQRLDFRNLDDGISIPCSYSSFVAPLSSSVLFNNAKTLGKINSLETPYVVRFRNVCELDTPQALWSFHHPNLEPKFPLGHPDFNVHNTRYWEGQFSIDRNCIIVRYSLLSMGFQGTSNAYCTRTL